MYVSDHARRILIPIHLLFAAVTAAWVYNGAHVPWPAAVLAVAWWTLLSGLGIAVGFHRYFSHLAFPAKPWARKLMLGAGTLAGQGSPIFWVALHMGYHHPHSDERKDVHSPVHGIWSAYMGWMIRLRPDDVSLKYAVRLLRDPLIVTVHQRYYTVFWLAYAAILGIAATAGLPYVMAVMTALIVAVHQECAVNVLNHSRWFGYVNYYTGDNSVNNVVTGLLCWGQGWHNNHHQLPGRANFGVRWFEYDPTRLLIPLVRAR